MILCKPTATVMKQILIPTGAFLLGGIKMVRYLLNHFPTWGVILIMMLICCLIGWIVYFIVNRYGEKFLVAKDPHYARESIHLAATLCAFILAFMIVLLWQSYQTLEDTLMSEAR